MAALDLLDFSGRSRTPIILQNELSECGFACLAMVASHHGHRIDLTALQREHAGSNRGATLAELIQVAAKLKLGARPLKAALEDLAKLQLPAILHWDFNHFVVLTRVGRSVVEIHDPSRGRQRLPWAEISKHYTGVALELTPEREFQPRSAAPALSLGKLLGKLSGVGRALSTVLLLALALEVFSLVAPLFMQLVVDSAVVSEDRDLLALLGIGFLLLGLVRVSITSLRAWVVMVLSTQLNFQLLGHLFRHLLRLPQGFFERRHLGDIVSRFESMSQIQRTLTTSFIEAMLDGLMVIATLVMMAVYSRTLTGVVVAAAGLYALLRLALYRPLREAQEEEIRSRARQHSNFLESVRGIQSIKLFNRQPLRRTQYQNLLADQFNASIRVQRLGILYKALNGTLFAVENVAVVWLGALLILDGGFSVGMLFAFVAYKQQFIGRSTTLVENAIELKILSLHTERVADIALAEPEPEADTGSAPVTLQRHGISVRDLCFQYAESEPRVFNNLNFAIEEGESVAIIGPSGCGKTTLLKVMLGLLPPSSGEVLIGGLGVDRLGPERFRSLVGTVMQDDQLFAGSIADNISFFDPEPDWERIAQCAELAAIHEEILAMPMHYHTMVGDMGSVLSGGQKQRVLLARALYKRPKILMLDEATSHLDVAREQKVNQAVMRLTLTRVIVAHRPETIASADRVITLEAPNAARQLRRQPLRGGTLLPATARHSL
jgi:ATP-binding cassette subfamily B protein RaxB